MMGTVHSRHRALPVSAAFLVLAATAAVSALFPAPTGSVFNVDGLLVDAMEPSSGDGKFFSSSIRSGPLVDRASRPMRAGPPPQTALERTMQTQPRSRAMESARAADTFAQSQDWKSALAAIQGGLDLEPENLMLIRRAAAYASLARRFGVADEYFRKAIQANPEDVPFLAGRAGILLRLLRLNEAEEMANRALALQPDYLAARLARICVKIARGDEDLELDEWMQITSGEATQLADWLDADRPDYVAALSPAGFETLCDIVLGPGVAAKLTDVARALKQAQKGFYLKNWTDARAALEHARGLGVRVTGIPMDIARTYFEEGNVAEAERLLGALAGQYPEVLLVQYNYAFVLLKMYRYPDAQRVLERANQIDPGNAQVAFALACAWASLNEPDRAWAALKSISPKHAEDLREWARGEEPYLQALRSDPRAVRFIAGQPQE